MLKDEGTFEHLASPQCDLKALHKIVETNHKKKLRRTRYESKQKHISMTELRRNIFLALFPFCCGYFFSYLLRAVNAVVAPDLVAEFGLSPGALGLLTSAYLLSFSLFQLPLGICLDRYGARLVQTALLSIAAAGCFLFAIAPNFYTLVIARAIIGLGFSAGLMASYKSSSIWVPLERRALVNSAIMSFGALGIVMATEPTVYLVDALGWRNAFLVFGGLIMVTAAFVFFAVPEKPITQSKTNLRVQVSELWSILKLPLFWRIAPLLGLTAGTTIALQTLWAGPWLRDVLELSRPEVARHLFWMACAFVVGIIVVGVVADCLQKWGVSVMTTMIGFISVHLFAQLVIVLQVKALAFPAWAVLAGVGQAAILAFPWFAAKVGTELAGRANATINFSMFLVAFLAQFLVGVIIGFFPATPSGYDPQSYVWAFGLFLALEVLALLWYLFAPTASLKDNA
jgi:predicted MFS family arabinose efflux permease